jgi:hypothetical protein
VCSKSTRQLTCIGNAHSGYQVIDSFDVDDVLGFGTV